MLNSYFPLAVQLLQANPLIWLQFYKGDTKKIEDVTLLYFKTLFSENTREISYLILKDLAAFNAFAIWAF